MGHIKNIIFCCFLISNCLGQELKGSGKHSVFVQMEPEFLALSFDESLRADNNGFHLSTGFKINLGLWLGVPFEVSYLIPVGSDKMHLMLGLASAYVWNSQKSPYEYWYGAKTGFRIQPENRGLFMQAQIIYRRKYYFDGQETIGNWRFTPNLALGYTF